MSNPAQDQSSQKQVKKKPGKIKECPNCGLDWKSGYLGWAGFYNTVYCVNCGWNEKEIPTRITREQYKYWYRLYRIRMQGWQYSPPKRKQPLHILQSIIHEVYARDVPRWIQKHLEDAHGWRYSKGHYWIYQSSSRWEYHSMLKDGLIKTPQDYQSFVVNRREWDTEPYEDDYYDEGDY